MLEKDNVFTEEKFNEMVDYVTNKQPELMNEEIKKENAHFEKIRASSLYGKIGDAISNRLGHYQDVEFTREVSEEEMKDRMETLLLAQEAMVSGRTKEEFIKFLDEKREEMKGATIIPVDSIPQGSGKTSMMREAIQSAFGDRDGDFVIIDEPSMMPKNFEGFKPGQIVIIDTLKEMENLAKGQMRDFSLRALEINKETNLPLNRTERRKQQRKRAKELKNK